MKSKTRTQNKYVNYTAEVVLKRVLKYVWKSKFMIICSLLFLIAYTFLELYLNCPKKEDNINLN